MGFGFFLFPTPASTRCRAGRQIGDSLGLQVRFKIRERLQNRTRHVGEALSLPKRRSRLGSTFGGAAERSEAEGVHYDEWYKLSLRTTPSGFAIAQPPFNSGMIATGNHNFERFAALCNTLSGEARALRASGRLRASPTGAGKPCAYSNQRSALPQSARSGCQLPQRGSQGGCAAAGGFEPPLPGGLETEKRRVGRLALPVIGGEL